MGIALSPASSQAVRSGPGLRHLPGEERAHGRVIDDFIVGRAIVPGESHVSATLIDLVIVRRLEFLGRVVYN
jgi:hypothetical protein